jgi:glycosyltransferase involved in cell wall biosynthesis
MGSIDVIVPCYRYGHFLRECVHSVLTQTVDNLRVLILDDYSPDNTADVAAGLVANDSRVTYRRHRANKGHIYTYNEGIEWTSADYTLLLSADDYLLPDALQRAARFMDTNPEVGFVFGSVILLHNNGNMSRQDPAPRLARRRPWIILTGREFIELTGASNIVPTPTAVVRTQLQKRLGGYRRELPHSGDMEMWLRFAAACPVGILRKNQAVYRCHGTNMSSGYPKLLDFQQRKAALDVFFDSSSHALAEADCLRRRLFRTLACDCVRAASGAFNDCERTLASELTRFAIDVDPGVRRSVPWLALACKRLLGVRASNRLRTVVKKPTQGTIGQR